MTECYAVVITTINYPTRGVIDIARDSASLNAEFILIGDEKSPKDFVQPGATYLDLDRQLETGFEYAKIAPSRHYARKNIGYLHAIRNGATIIIETDDDNIPRREFWLPRTRNIDAQLVKSNEWTNVYAYFSDDTIWPRGLPLNLVQVSPPERASLILQKCDCPIQQGLADENPDVDAIYRLILPLPVSFSKKGSIALSGAWCPFNSQNTTWWRDAFPLLYLPYYCSFRMTDIWRSFVAQRIAYLNGWSILFHNSTVFQERNEHDLMKDFTDEIPGYLYNEKIKSALLGLNLTPGLDRIPDAMRACYECLIEMSLIANQEKQLLEAWLNDLATIKKS